MDSNGFSQCRAKSGFGKRKSELIKKLYNEERIQTSNVILYYDMKDSDSAYYFNKDNKRIETIGEIREKSSNNIKIIEEELILITI